MPRPDISGELKQEVAGLTADDFNVPAHRVSFEDRVEVILEKYREVQEENEELRERVAELEEELNEVRLKGVSQNIQQSSRR